MAASSKRDNLYPGFPAWVGWLYALAGVVLVPWIAVLAIYLPENHISRHWDVTWVGFDIILFVLLVTTAYLSYKRSVWVVMSATATAVMMVVDSWFDITTARPGKALFQSVILAVFIELPLAVLTFFVARNAVRSRVPGA